MGDEPRLQSIGLDVAQVIREIGYTNLSVIASGTKQHIKHEIETRLAPRRMEIMELRDELFLKELDDFLGDGDQWSMTLHPDNIHIMETLDDKWIKNVIGGQHEEFQKELMKTAHAMAPMKGLLDTPRKTFGIFGGVLEEARALLSMIEIHAHLPNMPELAVSMGSAGFTTDRVSCDLTEGKPVFWFLKAILCPLKLGIQGIEALRAAHDIMRIPQTPNKEVNTDTITEAIPQLM